MEAKKVEFQTSERLVLVAALQLFKQSTLRSRAKESLDSPVYKYRTESIEAIDRLIAKVQA